jgi:hypothetical protein
MSVRQDDGSESLARWRSAFSFEEGHEVPRPDGLFGALSAKLRRQALFYLLEEPETTIEELADVLAGWRSTESGPVGPTERDQIAVELRHVHLPRLDGAKLVEYDSVGGDVRLCELPGSVRELVEFAHSYDDVVDERV